MNLCASSQVLNGALNVYLSVLAFVTSYAPRSRGDIQLPSKEFPGVAFGGMDNAEDTPYSSGDLHMSICSGYQVLWMKPDVGGYLPQKKLPCLQPMGNAGVHAASLP